MGTRMQATGERIKMLRERLLLTQADLALLVGVSAKTIGSWEAGAHEPQKGHIAALCDVFDEPAAVVRGEKPLRRRDAADERRLQREAHREIAALRAAASPDGDAPSE